MTLISQGMKANYVIYSVLYTSQLRKEPKRCPLTKCSFVSNTL